MKTKHTGRLAYNTDVYGSMLLSGALSAHIESPYIRAQIGVAVSVSTAALTTEILLASTTASTSTGSGNLDRLEAAASALSTATGDLTTEIHLEAAASALSTATGDIP